MHGFIPAIALAVESLAALLIRTWISENRSQAPIFYLLLLLLLSHRKVENRQRLYQTHGIEFSQVLF
ncbi:MAG TPA: hypothetical protein VF427_14055 [Noviherbaspirillum sp.]